ncbi:MAG: hypothetical protein H7263_06790 [Candidatus Sericytochromatia bacterium]|nr:hypothetical protein [Candidatus Sericytochromatia bacterium]
MSLQKKLIISLASISVVTMLSCSPKINTIVNQEPDNGTEKEDVVKITTVDNTTVRCGVERWAVKTGTDPDASKINLKSIIPTTVEALNNLSSPDPSTIKNFPRVSPTETTVFTIDATLTQFKGEGDSDYHLVLKDNKGNTMIGEIPSPDCVGFDSPFIRDITSARKAFASKYNVLPALAADGTVNPFQDANVPVRITGVGFFDFPHGQNGLAKNAIELHPVLSIIFK